METSYKAHYTTMNGDYAVKKFATKITIPMGSTLHCVEVDQDPLYQMVEDELDRVAEKHGADRTLDWGMWSLILGEEVGELQQAMLDSIDRAKLSRSVQRGDLEAIKNEVIQVAAVSLNILNDVLKRIDDFNG